MRELTEDEMERVGGGVLPLVGLALTAAEYFAVNSLRGYVISRASFVVGSIGAAQWLGDQRNAGS